MKLQASFSSAVSSYRKELLIFELSSSANKSRNMSARDVFDTVATPHRAGPVMQIPGHKMAALTVGFREFQTWTGNKWRRNGVKSCCVLIVYSSSIARPRQASSSPFRCDSSFFV